MSDKKSDDEKDKQVIVPETKVESNETEVSSEPEAQPTEMTSSLQGIPAIEKLKGRENYPTWKFAMQAYLEHEDMWKCVEGTELDARKLAKAKSKIILCVDPMNYSHIQSATTAKEVWEKLKLAFEDSGLTRKVSLLRALVTAQLSKHNSVEEYVNEIVTTAHKLKGLGFDVPDEWVGTLMLAGLPDEYKPMIMGIESSGTAITADSIKTKLLQDVKDTKAGASTSALTAFLTKWAKKKGPRCHNCGKIGHLAKVCWSKKKGAGENSQKEETKLKNSRNEKTFAAFLTTVKNGDWYVDSCSTVHLTNDSSNLQNEKSCANIEISGINSSSVEAEAIGQVQIPVKTEDGVDRITANDVIYAPRTTANLLSVSKIVKRGFTVTFSPKLSSISDNNGEQIAALKEEKGIYKLEVNQERAYFTATDTNIEISHRRLGHLNYKSVTELSKLPETNVKITNAESPPCEPCVKGKQHRKPFPKSKIRSTRVLELIHSDLCGPMENTSIGGAKYFLTIIDDFSRKTFVFFLEKKSQVIKTFIEFRTLVENETGHRIKKLRSDNGLEYSSNEFEEYLKASGIQHRFTIRYTPQQNGVAERENRTIIEKAKSMLFDAELAKPYWAEAVATDVYLGNRSPNSSIGGRMPEELWTGETPKLSHLKVFGCVAYVHVPKELRRKLDPSGEKLLFVGYCESSKGYRLIDPKTYKITKSRDVIFWKNYKYFSNNNPPVSAILSDLKLPNEEPADRVEQESDRSQVNEDKKESESSHYSDCFEENEDLLSEGEVEEVTPGEKAAEEEQVPLRRSTRTRKATNFDDFVTYLTLDNDLNDPETVEKALRSSDRQKWIQAMNEERDSLVENGTWIPTKLPAGKKTLDTKWVFRIKRDSSGNIQRYKARLVVRGCGQIEGIDYSETYSPVVRYTSIRFLCALATKYDLDMDQMDVKAAYLHGDIEEDIYVEPPEELRSPEDEGQVWKLQKSMYGLKQSGRAWNKKLNETLINDGFERSKADPCVYIKRTKRGLVIVAVYVDDLLILAKDKKEKAILKRMLSQNFDMKDLGEAKHLLGMTISRDREKGKVWLVQTAYIQKTLKKFNMHESKPVSTPCDTNSRLSANMEPKTPEEIQQMSRVPYREAVGSLIYASQGTRPDISFAVGCVSRYMHNPGEGHWTAVKRIMRYLKGTMGAKIEFSRTSKDDNRGCHGYCDADWGNDTDTRRSITGAIFLFQGGPIVWQSKRQASVALSTTEAEYMALSTTCQEALWLRALARYLEPCLVLSSTVILNDNKGAIDLSKNKGYRPRTKHIHIRHHFVREKVDNDDVKVFHIPTEEMTADALTKALPAPKFKDCIAKMGVRF